MSTSSILKQFYIKDQDAFDRLKKVLEEDDYRCNKSIHPSSLEIGREKLANFVFNDVKNEV